LLAQPVKTVKKTNAKNIRNLTILVLYYYIKYDLKVPNTLPSYIRGLHSMKGFRKVNYFLLTQ